MPSRPRHRGGFTLFELMVVLVLLAITSAAAIPAFLGDRFNTPDQRLATSVRQLLERTRDAARESGSPATFVLAPTGGRFWITTRSALETGMLPVSGSVRVVDPKDDRVSCRFEATGPATSCAITVRGARIMVVRVDRWTGMVTITLGAREVGLAGTHG